MFEGGTNFGYMNGTVSHYLAAVGDVTLLDVIICVHSCNYRCWPSFWDLPDKLWLWCTTIWSRRSHWEIHGHSTAHFAGRLSLWGGVFCEGRQREVFRFCVKKLAPLCTIHFIWGPLLKYSAWSLPGDNHVDGKIEPSTPPQNKMWSCQNIYIWLLQDYMCGTYPDRLFWAVQIDLRQIGNLVVLNQLHI